MKRWITQFFRKAPSQAGERRSAPIPLGRAARVHFGFLFILMTALYFLNQRFLPENISRPFLFQARAKLGQGPTLNPRIKIFGIDDQTFSFLGDWVMTSDQWVALLIKIAKNEPKAVFIDAVFAKVIGAAKNLKQLTALRVPVYVGGYTYAEKLLHRPVTEQIPDADSSKRVDSDDSVPGAPYYYTFHPDYERLFTGRGHFMYQPDFTVPPLQKVQGQLIAHMSLNLADKVNRQRNNRLIVDGRTIKLTPQGGLMVNFHEPSLYFGRTYSLEGVLRKLDDNRPLKSIQKDDVVLIIPHLYTGNTDIRPSPFGNIPGGYAIAALLSAVLQGDWLDSYMAFDLFYAGAVGAMAFAAVYCLSNIAFTLFLSLGTVVILSAAIAAFAFAGAEIPFVSPLLGLTLPALLIYFMKNRSIEKRNDNLRRAFGGHVSPETMRQLMEQDTGMRLETQERILSVMFIDLVGFSIFSHHLQPKAAFQKLQTMMAFIIKQVHAHGGMVDRTLGDGLLCYFGYSFGHEKRAAAENHADSAVRCALELQRLNIRKIFDSMHQPEPAAFPLRIGINTAPCYVGNIGSTERIDFTIVGNGVNFAKRLESCCTMNHVLISDSTFRFLKDAQLDPREIARKHIRIKHHDGDIQTYELNPYADNGHLLHSVERYYQDLSRKELATESWQVLDARSLRPLVNGKPAEITLLTRRKIHLKSFFSLMSGEAFLAFETVQEGGAAAPQTSQTLTGTLILEGENSDQSRDYTFVPHENEAEAFQQVVLLVLKRTVSSTQISAQQGPRSIVYGSRG